MTKRRLIEIERLLNGQMVMMGAGFSKVAVDWKVVSHELLKEVKRLRQEVKHRFGWVPGDETT